MDTGDAKNWAGQVGARRDELTLKALFSEELGVVLQVRTAERNDVMQTLREHGLSLHSHFIGKTRPAVSRHRRGQGRAAGLARCQGHLQCQARRPAPGLGQRELADLPARDNPACADAEHAAAGAPADPGLHVHLTFDPAQDVAAPFLNLSRPKVAVLREQGVNSHVEMAYAFTEAGFEAHDVHMTDLQSGRARLEDFKGVVACGGFSYGDTLGAGIGWARSITFNPVLAEQFQGFFARAGHLWPGRVQRLPDVCRTGRHHPRRAGLAALHHQPERALRGPPVAGGSARIPQPVPAGMAGSRLPIAVAHGEGFANFKYRGNADKAIAAMRFVDHTGAATEAVPVQPQRQPRRPDGVTTADGRFTAMMPHPERVFRNIQMSWMDHAAAGGQGAFSPWMRLWRNARKWVG
jgi:phosphoribosylformylglycinamidine synthase